MTAKQTAVKKYIVKLSDAEREQLNTLIRSGKHRARQLIRARILLKADAPGPEADALTLATAASTLAQQDDIGLLGTRVNGRNDLAQELRRHIPLPAVAGDDRHRLFVVARQHAFDLPLAWRLERDPVTDLEFQHLRVCTHLMKKAEARNDAMVEVDEFGFRHFVDVDLHQDPAAQDQEVSPAYPSLSPRPSEIRDQERPRR